MKVYLDGEWSTEAKISVLDRGFMYGEGVYESLRTYSGNIFSPRKHYERFKISAVILGIPFEVEFTEFMKILNEGIEGMESDCTIRTVITNGDGKKPAFLVYVMELQAPDPDLYTYGVNVGISKFRRIQDVAIPSALKTTSHASSMMARQGKENFYEILMLNDKGFVAEGLMSNIFFVENLNLITPSIETGILDGITREVVIDLARSLEIKVEERLVNVDELFNCSEMFLTRTSAAIIPVRKIESRLLFENEPGGVTQFLMENFNSYILQRQDLWFQQ
jgi:branched-chain amino acid aminotransferase